ncbi:MAG: Hsp20/alpha crystallin family protein [Planctomycetota bacterium]
MQTKYFHPVKYNPTNPDKLSGRGPGTGKLSSDGTGDEVCRIGSSGFSEIFISSSKLVSIYTEKVFSPPTDIFETDKEFVIRSEVAGMKPEEILVSLDGNKLIITGSRDERDARAKRTFRQMEIDYGKFEKVIEIYCGVEPEQSSGFYKDGFLEIAIPKSKKSGQTRGAKTIKHIEITLGKV